MSDIMRPIKKRVGINDSDLFLGKPEDTYNYLIMSKDATAFFRCKGHGDLKAKDLSKDETDDKAMFRNYDLALTSSLGSKAKFNRRALINMLELFDSENVVLSFDEDSPISFTGSKLSVVGIDASSLYSFEVKKRGMVDATGILAPIVSEDDE